MANKAQEPREITNEFLKKNNFTFKLESLKARQMPDGGILIDMPKIDVIALPKPTNGEVKKIIAA